MRNGSYAALMDIPGNVLWVSGPASSEQFFFKSIARGVTDHDFGAIGFYIVGEDQEHPVLNGLRDGYVSVALHSDGKSEPFIEDKGDDLN